MPSSRFVAPRPTFDRRLIHAARGCCALAHILHLPLKLPLKLPLNLPLIGSIKLTMGLPSPPVATALACGRDRTSTMLVWNQPLQSGGGNNVEGASHDYTSTLLRMSCGRDSVGRDCRTRAIFRMRRLHRRSSKSTSPDDAIARLKAGNERFTARQVGQLRSDGAVKQTASAQAPHAAIVGCIDRAFRRSWFSISALAMCSARAWPATSSTRILSAA